MTYTFGFDPQIKTIAITGGPCAGKTTLLAKLLPFCEDRGFRGAIAPETATELIMAGFRPWDKWSTPHGFQHPLLELSLARENLYHQALQQLETDKPKVLLLDRGLLDPIAYVGQTDFIRLVDELGLDVHMLRERYNAVVHLVTAAEGAEDFYTLANNNARTEPPNVACALDHRLRQAWLGHSHPVLIDNSTDFEGKMDRALTAIAHILGIPEPLEIEQRYKVVGFESRHLPPDTVAVEIRQNYLRGFNDVERRVRSRTIDGSTSYYYTEKRPTRIPDRRIERERRLTYSEYLKLLNERDIAAREVVKKRHCFYYGCYHWELDVMREPEQRVILEVEVSDENEHPTVPPWITVSEERPPSNRQIAYGSPSLTARSGGG